MGVGVGVNWAEYEDGPVMLHGFLATQRNAVQRNVRLPVISIHFSMTRRNAPQRTFASDLDTLRLCFAGELTLARVDDLEVPVTVQLEDATRTGVGNGLLVLRAQLWARSAWRCVESSGVGMQSVERLRMCNVTSCGVAWHGVTWRGAEWCGVARQRANALTMTHVLLFR